jgi:hypothetical protein
MNALRNIDHFCHEKQQPGVTAGCDLCRVVSVQTPASSAGLVYCTVSRFEFKPRIISTEQSVLLYSITVSHFDSYNVFDGDYA